MYAQFSLRLGHALSCAVCEVQTAVVLHREYAYAPGTDDATKHTVACGVCKHLFNTEAHTGGTATCMAKAKCELCHAAYGEQAPHTADSAWQITETHHYHRCTYQTEDGSCQERVDAGEHADLDKNGKCDACEYQMRTAGNPEEPDGDKEGLGTGAVVGIIIGSVALAGACGFALFWFVIKKKKWSDLAGIFKKQ